MKPLKLSFILILTALSLALCICAYDTDIQLETVFAEPDGTFVYTPDVSGDAVLSGEGFKDYLYEEFLNISPTINIQDYNYTLDNIQEILDIICELIYTNYDIYYVIPSFSCSYNTSTGVIIKITPSYSTTSRNEIISEVKAVEARIEEIISYTDDDMTDIQKLLTVYDRLILECEYDEPQNKKTVSDLLLDGTSVCAGYATALSAFAREFDIPCGFVMSKQMDHVWNLFYIDGEWYHADATWDDPIKDTYSRVNHTYFLKSDDWMVNNGRHYGFGATEADSDKFDDAFWHYSHSSVLTVDGKMYYITGNSGDYSLYCYNPVNDSYTELYSFHGGWKTSPSSSSIWVDAFSGLCYYDERFYFNTSTSIMSVDKKGNNPETIYTLDSGDINSIYGCFIDDNLIRFGTGPKSAPKTGDVLEREYIAIPGTEEPEYLKGDLTGDSSINVDDAILLLQNSLFPDLYPIDYSGNYDFNNDGQIDVEDAILLLQHSMFPDLYPLENEDDGDLVIMDYFFNMTGESFDEAGRIFGENNYGIKVVRNPDNRKDKVLYLETNVNDKQAWNYFWHTCSWVPGERYLISFSVRADCDAFGNPIEEGSIGINVRTDAKDYGVGTININGGEWVDVECIYTIPSGIDLSKNMRFGIFANPVELVGYSHNVAWSYYLDNISIVTYDGDLDDGIIE